MKNTPLTIGAIASIAVILNLSAFAADSAVTPPPPPKWDTSAAIGLTLTRGNSKSTTFNAKVATGTKREGYEISLGADALYGTANGAKNSDMVHGFAQYNYLFTERLYAYARIDGLRDRVAAIDYRVTIGPGLGYYFVKTPSTTLSGEVGPGYVFERQADANKNYLTARLAEKFEHKLNDHARIWQSVEFLPEVSYFKNFIVNFEAGIETTVTKHTTLSLILQETYDNVVPVTRQHHDVKLIFAFGWKF